MPEYREVNWDQAACLDTYNEMFYSVEEERNAYAYNYINAVRSICARCPIYNACLSYAFQYESYGVWGGLTSVERKAMISPRLYPAQRRRALFDLEGYGITKDQVESCLPKGSQ